METPDKISGEISIELMESIINTLPFMKEIYNPDYSILIHGMGGKTRWFYRNLKRDKNIKVLWYGWCSTVWWTYLLSFIPGQAGLVQVLNKEQIGDLYQEIGDLSMCGLYFIPNTCVHTFLKEIKRSRDDNNLKNLVNKYDNYFLLTVDFDYYGISENGEIYYRDVIIGENLDKDLKHLLTLM